MSSAVVVGLTAAVAVVAAVLVTAAIRSPVVRRLGIRSVRRRPAEAVLVTAAALLGTAIITGSLVVGDTLRSSLRAGAFTHLGPIDETVTAPGVDALPRLRRALAGLEEAPAVDGVAFGLRARGAAAVGLDHDPVVAPDVLLVELDIEEVRDFGGDPGATGLGDARTPGPGQAAISADLAEELAVDVGARISVFAYGRTTPFEVVDVLPRVGLAGYSTDLDAKSFDVFLPPGTLEGLVAAAERPLPAPPVAVAFVSNEGDVLGGAERTDRVLELIRERIEPLPQAAVTASKQQVVNAAEEIGARLSEIFLGIGAFAVIAGMLLLVNVFVMLAEERRSELGIMRAVGMQRRDLVAAFAVEGSLYAAAAAVLGAAAGIAVGAAIVQVAQGISGGPATFTLDIRFDAQPTSVGAGLMSGLLVSLFTVVATSARMSRLNPVRAIRDLPEPPRARHRLLAVAAGWVAVTAGLVVTAAGVSAASGVPLLAGPALLAVGVVVLLAGRLGRRRVLTLAGGLLVAWGIVAPTLLPGAFRNAEATVFVVQGLVITGAAVAVLADNQDVVGRTVRRVTAGTGNLPTRLGLAYPLGRPFRTTMTLAMYALVIFTVVLVALLARVFGGQVGAFSRAEAGAFDLLVRSAPANPLPPDDVRHLPGVEVVAPLRYAAFNVEFRAPGHDEFRRWFASGFDRRLLEARPPTLDRWLSSIASERAVWQRVLEDPSVMIVGSRFLQEGGAPQPVELGDVVAIRDPITGASDQRMVVAVMEGGLAFSGAFMAERSLVTVLGPTVPANRLYVALEEGADAQEVAATIEERYIRYGVQAETFRSIVAERQQANLQFLRLLQGYLLLGLLVGVAGLAVIMLRAVRERRGQIAVLRSFGVQAGTIGRSFMLEAGFVALQGILIGTALATATAYQLITNAAALGGIDVGFEFAWAEIAALLGVTLAASVLAAAWPARQASTTAPAVALRGAD